MDEVREGDEEAARVRVEEMTNIVN